jgi:RNA polymerase sigma-70 factor (ECF subfamily)
MSGDTLDLARRAAEGDSKAVAELLDRHLPELRAFVRLRAGAVVRAKEAHSDIVQSTCREVLEHIDRFQFPTESAFRQWLFTTALRKLVHRRDYYMAEKRGGLNEAALDASSGVDGAERLAACYHSFASPSRVAALREEVERIEAAFEELSEEHREVITLAKVVGLSRAEIGEQMGRSEGAVKMLLARALAELAAKLG